MYLIVIKKGSQDNTAELKDKIIELRSEIQKSTEFLDSKQSLEDPATFINAIMSKVLLRANYEQKRSNQLIYFKIVLSNIYKLNLNLI